MEAREALRSDVLAYLRRGARAPVEGEEFERLALRVFEYQFAENGPYRRFCERRARTPDSVARWSEIPAIPTAAFKAAALVCGDAAEAEIVFRTSGTTQGPEGRGAHYVRDLSLYAASALPNFQAHLLPDGARLRFLILGPSPTEAPDSSLAWMLERVRAGFGAPGSDYFIDARGLRRAELEDALAGSVAAGKPVTLLGTAAAFTNLLDALQEAGRRYTLPAGSRVMETGGFKGGGRAIPRVEFYARLIDRLGLSEFY